MKRTASLLLATLILTGCTVENSDAQIEQAIEEGGAYTQSSEESKVTLEDDKEISKDSTGDKFEIISKSQNKIDSSKLLSKHSMEIETIDMKETVSSIEKETHRLNGYVSSNKTEKGRAISEMSIKFPANNSAEMKKFLNKNFEIVSEETEAVDVSNNFYDLDSRIKGLEERENRLKETYDTSQSVEEIILIDEKVFEVIIEKENLLRQKLKIENRENFSKIDIRLKEVKKIYSEEEPSPIVQEFKNSMNVVKEFLSKTLILFIKVIPAMFFSLGMGAILALILYIKYKFRKQS